MEKEEEGCLSAPSHCTPPVARSRSPVKVLLIAVIYTFVYIEPNVYTYTFFPGARTYARRHIK